MFLVGLIKICSCEGCDVEVGVGWLGGLLLNRLCMVFVSCFLVLELFLCDGIIDFVIEVGFVVIYGGIGLLLLFV